MSELLQAPERKGLLISEQDIPFSAYQAIYHKLTKKVETFSREYKDPYQIEISDIKNLHQRLNQLLEQYNIQGKRCEISHSTKNGFSRTHSSFEKFNLSSQDVREYTTTLNYQLDFLIVLPAQMKEAEGIAQRYKLDIEFEQDFFDEDDAKVPYFLRGFVTSGSLRAKIEYTDFSVAQAIDATIAGWTGQLRVKKKSKFQKFLASKESFIRSFTGLLAASTPFIGGAIYSSTKQPIFDQSVTLVLSIISLSIISSYVIQGLVSKFYSAFQKTVPCPSIRLTQGDRERCENVESISRKSNVVLGFVFVTCFTGIVLNVFAAWIFEQIF